MECVTTVQYSICFNNVPLDSFKPVIEPPQKRGVCHLKIDGGIHGEARMHTHQAYNNIIEVKVKLLQLRFRVYNQSSRRYFKR
jgi:hypothetical protein